MKGLMVALLVLLMTGTVTSQQPNQQDGTKPGRIVIWLSDVKIQELKQNPMGLIYRLEESARGKLTEVRMRYDKIATSARDAMPKSNSRFNLWLNDNSIDKLVNSTYGLVAQVPDDLKDNIVEVVLMHEKPNEYATPAPKPPTPQPDDGGIQISGPAGSLPPSQTLPRRYGPTDQTAGSRNFQTDDNSFSGIGSRQDFRTPPRGTQLVSQDTPTLSEKLRQLRERSRNSGFGNDSGSARSQDETSDTFRPRFGSTGQQTSQQQSQYVPKSQYPPQQEQLNDSGYEYGTNRRRLADLPVNDDYQQRKAAPPKINSPLIDNSDIEFERELVRRRTEELKAQRAVATRIEAQRKLAEEKAQFEEELYLQRLREESLARVNARDSIAPKYPNYLDERYASRVAQPAVQNPSNQFPRRTVDNRLPAGYDYDRIPERTRPTSTPRIAQTGTRVPSLTIPGTKDAVTVGDKNKQSIIGDSRRDDRAYGFMFFMLMFSIGLNVYLIWIARGFYVRYNELADELRETFTSTM